MNRAANTLMVGRRFLIDVFWSTFSGQRFLADVFWPTFSGRRESCRDALEVFFLVEPTCKDVFAH